MRGHVRQRERGAKGSWEVVAELPRDPETGARRQHFETVRGTKRDAQRRLRELLTTIEQGQYIPSSRVTVGSYLTEWAHNYGVLHTSPRTAESYGSEIRRHIIPALGAKPLSELRPQDLERFYAHSLTAGRRDGKGGLSARTVLYHHRILSEALEHAVRTNVIGRNPAKLADPPRPARPAVSTLAIEDVPRFLQAASESSHFSVFALALYTGLRLGELLGLRWKCVDLDHGALAVTVSLYREGSQWQLREPKSAKSRRQVALPQSMIRYLAEHKARQAAYFQEALGIPHTGESFVFTTIGGGPLDRHSVSRSFARALERAGLAHIRFHDLRHTHASLLLKAGVPAKVVSERLGHASAAFTMDVYGHMMRGMQEEAAAKLDAMVGPMPEKMLAIRWQSGGVCE